MLKSKEPEVTTNNFNRICVGTEIIGTINTTTDFRIDGYVEGNINSKGKIVVGEKARLKGDIISRNADILGAVEGTITISELLCIKSTGVVTGNITTRKITIEVGAQFNGNCNMTDNISETIPDGNK
ncbi:MAG: polymer-forming cytoskeletal protein [Prevotellaceae bacterium]|jgi:cytoskeletal protein CcmA (bactofilin family)|nr:polymer-forming cytoskeletal protein [Prevotellaceae bacterium]